MSLNDRGWFKALMCGGSIIILFGMMWLFASCGLGMADWEKQPLEYEATFQCQTCGFDDIKLKYRQGQLYYKKSQPELIDWRNRHDAITGEPELLLWEGWILRGAGGLRCPVCGSADLKINLVSNLITGEMYNKLDTEKE